MSEAAAVKKETKAPVNTILPDKFGLAEHKRRDWVADVKPTVKPDEILVPAFWAHVAEQMNPLDTIEVRWEDGSRIQHLRVLWCERTYAKVKVVSEELLGEITVDAPEGSQLHKIDWKGPTLKFCVIRLRDNEIVHQNCKDRAVAAAWLVEHEKG